MKHAAPHGHHAQLNNLHQKPHSHAAPQQLSGAKGHKSGHAGLQQDWLGGIDGLAGPGLGFGYGAAPYAAGYAGVPAVGGFGYAGYGPANWADASIANYDDYAALRAADRSTWDGMIAGQDTLAAADYAARSDAAWKQGNTDSAAALKARKAQYKAWANADNDAVDAANDFKTEFEAAQTFNTDAKAGKGKDELTWAETVEDEEEKGDDDIDTNKTADAEGEE